MKYCQTCGEQIHEQAEFCPKCGVRCADAPKKTEQYLKGKGIGFVMSFFLGIAGALICHFLGDEDAKHMAWKTLIIMAIISVALIVLIFIIEIIAISLLAY